MATAITYRTGESAGKLRTVVVEDVRHVKLISGSGMDILTGKLLHGTRCGHEFWDQELGTSGDDFAVPATTTVKGSDIKAGQVVKFGGRWLRVVEFLDEDWQGHSVYKGVAVIKHDRDPRLTKLPSYRKFKLIWANDEYPTREQPAPVWDWVTRQIEREEVK
jgi:hypothetical protein